MAKNATSVRHRRQEVLRNLGLRIRTLRRQRGLTQGALAEAVELSVAYMSLIERGSRNPPFTTVVAIAHALEVPLIDVCSEL